MKGFRVILKSGVALPDFICEEFNFTPSTTTYGKVNIDIKRAEHPKPIYIAPSEVAASSSYGTTRTSPARIPARSAATRHTMSR